jgi:hypothetical protein
MNIRVKMRIFLSYVNRYDIVGFAETLNDTPRNLPNFPPPLTIKATKRKRRGRPSGGIAVYCKPYIGKITLFLKFQNLIM